MTAEADAFRGAGPAPDLAAAAPGNGRRRWHVAASVVAAIVALPVLAIAWTAFMAGNPDEQTFEVDWLAARAAALEANSMSVPFRNPM